MRRSISKYALVAALAVAPVLGVGGLSLSGAQAQGFNIEVGPNGIRPVPNDSYDRGYDRRRGGCSEREARAAARDEGLRGAEVIRVTRNSVTVEGETRRGVQRIRFANQPGCPTLG